MEELLLEGKTNTTRTRRSFTLTFLRQVIMRRMKTKSREPSKRKRFIHRCLFCFDVLSNGVTFCCVRGSKNTLVQVDKDTNLDAPEFLKDGEHQNEPNGKDTKEMKAHGTYVFFVTTDLRTRVCFHNRFYLLQMRQARVLMLS